MGQLPLTGALSINDINVAFYNTSNVKGLRGLLADGNVSLPAGINDLRGCRYCEIVADRSILFFNLSQYGSQYEQIVTWVSIPVQKDVNVSASEPWITIDVNNSYCCVDVWVSSESSQARSGVLTLYDQDANYYFDQVHIF